MGDCRNQSGKCLCYRKKYCTECGVELAEQTTSLEKLYNDGLFLSSPEQFVERMNIMLSEQGDSNLSVESDPDEDDFAGIILLDGKIVGLIMFSNDDGVISSSQKDTPCFYSTSAIISGNENTIDILLALIQVCNPTLDYSEALDLALIIADGHETTENGITYDISKVDSLIDGNTFRIDISID